MTERTRRGHPGVLGWLAGGCVALLLATAPSARLAAHGDLEQEGDVSPSTPDVVRFLEQATFGPTLDLIAHVREVGLEGYLTEQSHAPASS